MRTSVNRMSVESSGLAGDIVENQAALSRWHPDYKQTFRRIYESAYVRITVAY
jgi:hypothetical protein